MLHLDHTPVYSSEDVIGTLKKLTEPKGLDIQYIQGIYDFASELTGASEDTLYALKTEYNNTQS